MPDANKHDPLTARGFLGMIIAGGLGYALDAAKLEQARRDEQSPERRLARLEEKLERLAFELDELRRHLTNVSPHASGEPCTCPSCNGWVPRVVSDTGVFVDPPGGLPEFCAACAEWECDQRRWVEQ